MTIEVKNKIDSLIKEWLKKFDKVSYYKGTNVKNVALANRILTQMQELDKNNELRWETLIITYDKLTDLIHKRQKDVWDYNFATFFGLNVDAKVIKASKYFAIYENNDKDLDTSDKKYRYVNFGDSDMVWTLYLNNKENTVEWFTNKLQKKLSKIV